MPTVIIACDDSKTAVAYFNVLKREVKDKVLLNVIEAPYYGATPGDVVAAAAGALSELGPRRDREPSDSAWALIDLEAELSRQRQARDAVTRAKKYRVNALLSQPCYEVWTLAHLVDTGEGFKDCAAVVARLKKEWKKTFGDAFDKKAQVDISKLSGLRDSAVLRAKKHHKNKDQSWTEVYRVVEKILQLAQ